MASTRFGGFAAIVFDAYETLFDVDALQEVCATVVSDPEPFVLMWRAKQLEYAILRTVIDQYSDWGQITSEALDYTISRFELVIDPDQRGRLMRAWVQLPAFPDVHDALARLDHSGGRIIILSNATQVMLRPLIAQNGLTEYIDDVLTSELVQVFKPNQFLYSMASERLMARPHEVLFVTANGFDVAGAKAASLSVCWLNRRNLPLDPLGYEPDFRVHHLGELVDLLLGGSDEDEGDR